MKKIFSLIVAISILGAVAAPSFAQGRNTRTYCPPVPRPTQRQQLPPALPRIAADLGTVFGAIFNSRPSGIGVGAGVGGCVPVRIGHGPHAVRRCN